MGPAVLDHSASVWVCGGRREGTSEAAPEAVRQAVGGGCQSGWGRLLSVTNAIEAGTWRQGQWLGIRWAPWRGGGGTSPLFQCVGWVCQGPLVPRRNALMQFCVLV